MLAGLVIAKMQGGRNSQEHLIERVLEGLGFLSLCLEGGSERGRERLQLPCGDPVNMVEFFLYFRQLLLKSVQQLEQTRRKRIHAGAPVCNEITRRVQTLVTARETSLARTEEVSGAGGFHISESFLPP